MCSNFNGEATNVYSQKGVIAKGMLIDLMQPCLIDVVKKGDFRCPLTMSKTAFNRYVELDEHLESIGLDIRERLWDILYVLKFQGIKFRCRKERNEITFSFFSIPVKSPDDTEPVGIVEEDFQSEGFADGTKICSLKAVYLFSDGDFSITITLPNEN